MPVESIAKGDLTYESNFLEIRVGFKYKEQFVEAVNNKLLEGWEIANVHAVGSYLMAYMYKSK